MVRLIARLDIKGPHLIKSIQMEGVRKLGDPNTFARRYYDEGIDEILYVDAVASLYDRDQLIEIVERTAEQIFVPITVAGGIRNVDDARAMLRAGADKIAINSAAVKNPRIIADVAQTLGNQCMVLSIEAKSCGPDRWEAYCDGGREHTGRDVVNWAREGERLGAGEIMITSVDREGTQRGFDISLIRAVNEAVSIPVIASGGLGNAAHFVEAAQSSGADAFAMAHVLHYNKLTVGKLRAAAASAGIPVRTC
jgi:imidazole glycerol-phosphate synthase subunit HisF